MSRATVLTLDTLDDRREVWTALIRGLTPVQRCDFLDWCCELLRATSPPSVQHIARHAKANRVQMRNMIRLATQGDAVADAVLTNEIYADIAGLCHQWGLDYLTVARELESWAKGREPTPPISLCPF